MRSAGGPVSAEALCLSSSLVESLLVVASPVPSAACPAGLWLVDCQCSSAAGACSGAFGPHNACLVRANGPAYAVARCAAFGVAAAASTATASLSISMMFHVVSALSYSTAAVQCPEGSVVLGTSLAVALWRLAARPCDSWPLDANYMRVVVGRMFVRIHV